MSNLGKETVKILSKIFIRPRPQASLFCLCALPLVMGLFACNNDDPPFPNMEEAANEIVTWDNTSETSSINWNQAKKLYPQDPNLAASVAYGYSSSRKLSIGPDDHIIYDMTFDLPDALSKIEPGSRIYATSTGGRGRVAIDAVEVIHARQFDITVIGYCYSACVENILPAARSVTAFDRPILGVHGNIHSALDYIKSGGKDPCEGEDQSRIREELEGQVARVNEQLRRTGHKTDFWRKQIEVLGDQTLVSFQTNEGDCGVIQQFAVDYWLPTSEEFKEYFNLEIEGPLCNDSQECLTERLPLFLDQGQKVIWKGQTLNVEIPKSINRN